MRALLCISPLLGLLVACGNQDSDPPKTVKEELKTTSLMSKRTVDVSAVKAKRGQKTYEALCVNCHGDNAEGRVGMAPSLASESFLAAAGDEFLIRTIQHGRTGTTMVPWALKVPRDAAEDLVSYLRSMTPTEPAHLDESPLRGDVAQGEKIFASICSACHGKHGQGYQESVSGTAIRGRDFLTSATDGFLRYVIRNGKSGTKMRPFLAKSKVAVANLSDADIDDVIAYMRHNAN